MRQYNRLGRWFGPGAIALCMLALPSTRLLAAEDENAAPAEQPARADTLGTAEPQEEEAEGPNRGRISFTLTNDFVTAYMFRGILQERNGFIWQPAVDIGFTLYEGDGPLSSVALGFGIWNSFQTEKTFASGNGPSNLYETDYYPSLTLGWSPGIETSLTYLVYTGPNGSFDTIQQLDLGVAYDDSELLGDFAMGPTATFSFELENSSFGSNATGKYFELTIEPGLDVTLPIEAADDYPVTLSFPMALGLSMDDYYDTGTSNPVFGFYSFGMAASIPLTFIPEDLGSWSIGAAITAYVLDDVLKPLVDNDDPFPVGTGSIVMEY